MSELAPEYPTMEVALSAISRKPFANERVLEGDIVEVRRPQLGIGRREASEFLWLRLTGPEVDELAGFKRSLVEADTTFDKRRFCIPFDRLPPVDLARVRDPNDAYQPFLPVDFDSGLFLEGAAAAPLSVAGRVFDKSTGLFL